MVVDILFNQGESWTEGLTNNFIWKPLTCPPFQTQIFPLSLQRNQSDVLRYNICSCALRFPGFRSCSQPCKGRCLFVTCCFTALGQADDPWQGMSKRSRDGQNSLSWSLFSVLLRWWGVGPGSAVWCSGYCTHGGLLDNTSPQYVHVSVWEINMSKIPLKMHLQMLWAYAAPETVTDPCTLQK